MSDSYLSFVNSPWGRWLARTAGLPQPLALQRHRSGQLGLANPVIVAGAGRLAAQIQRIFSATDTVTATAATLKAPSTVKVQGGGRGLISICAAGGLGITDIVEK